MNDQIVDFRQRLHPTPVQLAGLRRMAATVRAVQLGVHTTLLSRAAGHPVSLLAAASGDPAVPRHAPGKALATPAVNQRQLLDEMRSVRHALGWTAVPASALEWAVISVAQAWRARGAAPRRMGDLPPVDALPPPVIALRNPLAVDAITLEILGLGDHALVEADLYLLPTPYARALWYRQQVRLAHEAARLVEADERHVRGSGTVVDALRLRARYASAGLQLDGRGLLPPLPPGTPELREQAVLRQVGGAAGCGWEVVWSFRVRSPARWVVDDVLGVDPGQRHTWAYASGALSGVIPRPHAGAWEWPRLPPTLGITPDGERRARAWMRWALYERMRPGHDQFLTLALRHRVCAVEDVDWAGFRWPRSYAAYAADSGIGIRAALEWLDALAPLGGTEVIRTPAAYSSRTCSRCGRLGARPGSGRPFACRWCGHRELADINAARNHRQRALERLAARRGH